MAKYTRTKIYRLFDISRDRLGAVITVRRDIPLPISPKQRVVFKHQRGTMEAWAYPGQIINPMKEFYRQKTKISYGR